MSTARILGAIMEGLASVSHIIVAVLTNGQSRAGSFLGFDGTARSSKVALGSDAANSSGLFLSSFLAILCILSLPERVAAQEPAPPSRPILLVHGWCGSARDWAPVFKPLSQALSTYLYPQRTEYGSKKDVYDVYVVEYDALTKNIGFYKEDSPSDEQTSLTYVGVDVPSTARFFVVNFIDPYSTSPNDLLEVARVSVLNKAYELSMAIQSIKQITHAQQVEILAHSMGGLDARAYVENMASSGTCYDHADSVPNYSLDTCSPGADTASYRNDVADIITLDTPHAGSSLSGSALANILNGVVASLTGNLTCQGTETTNSLEIKPGSDLLRALNYGGSIAGKSPKQLITPVHAIEDYSLDSAPWTYLDGYSDYMVLQSSQSIEQNVPANNVPSPHHFAFLQDTEESILPSSIPDECNLIDLRVLGFWPMLHPLSCLSILPSTISDAGKRINTDNQLWINSWSVTPLERTDGDNVTIGFSAINSTDSPLSTVTLWRAPDDGGTPGPWEQRGSYDFSGTAPVQGTFTDKPDPGKDYWYDTDLVASYAYFPDDGVQAPGWFKTTFTGGTETLTVSVTGSGTVSTTDGNIICPGKCTYAYNSGDRVTLVAAPAAGSVFSNWGGDCSGVSDCTLTMNAPKTVTADFAPESANYQLIVSVVGGGIVSSTDGKVNCSSYCWSTFAAGTSFTFSATPISGWTFTGWGGACSGTGSCTIAMSAARTVTATFTVSGPTTYALTVESLNPSSGVSISVDPSGSDGAGNGTTTFSRTFVQATQVTLTAPALVGGNSFFSWTNCDAAQSTTCTVSMSANRVVIASYIAPVSSDMGTVLIGQTSAATSVALSFDTSATMGSMSALTQGSSGLDFAISSAGTCQAGTYYSTGSSCAASVTFTPQFAGLRNGAVVIKDSGGNAIATGYVYGTGSGPQVSFLPGSQSTLHSGFGNPQGVAVDGSGNLYVADATNNAVYEIPAAGGYASVKLLGGNFSSPVGIALDGGGNVFVADAGNNAVKKIPPGCISYSCVEKLGGGTTFNGLLGVAVDRSGNVFGTTSTWNGNTGFGGGQFEILAAGGYATVNQLGVVVLRSTGIAVDGSGNVFVPWSAYNDGYYSGMTEILAAGGYTTSNNLPSSWGSRVAVDGRGNVVVTSGDTNNSSYTVTEFPSGCLASNCTKTLASGAVNATGVAVDGSGNVFFTENTNKQVEKLDFADAPSLTFPTPTPVGSTDTADGPQTVTAQNIGTAPLTFQPFASGNMLDATLASLGVTDCTQLANLQLAPGANCNLGIEFQPQQTGLVNGYLNVVDDSLYATNARQSVAIIGRGGDPGLLEAVTVSPQSLTFPSQALNVQSASQSVILTNWGNTSLTISHIAATGDFSESSNCPAALAASTSCIINVTFTPGASGVRTGSLSVIDSDSSSPQNVALSGTGIAGKMAPSVMVTPSLSIITSKQQLPVTVVVNGPTNAPTPTGSITLTSVGYASPATPLSGGTAIITIGAGLLNTGTGMLTAVYSGDSSYVSASGSNLVTLNNGVTGYFGTVPIGQTSAATAVALTFDTGGTMSSVTALTQGSAGLDFAMAGAGTCQVGTYYSAGNSCMANVTFSPQFAGLRNGAVVVKDSGGNAIATGYMYGTGSGPQVGFLPGTQSTLRGGFGSATGVAVDGSGNLYVADSTNNAVYEIPAAGGYASVKLLGGGFSYPNGIAVDAGGNVFVSDAGNNAVKKIPPGCSTSSCVNTLTSFLNGYGYRYAPQGVAVDKNGNVFVVATYWDGNVGNKGAVFDILAAGGYTTVNQLGVAVVRGTGIAVDGNGNVFVPWSGYDSGYYSGMVEILAASGYTASNNLPSGWGSKVAVDGRGNVVVTSGDSNNSSYTVTEFPSGCLLSNCSKTLASGAVNATGVAVDGSGNVFFTENTNNQVVKLDFADAPGLNFPTPTPIGSADTADGPQTVTVQNIGNAPLTFQPFIASNMLDAALASLGVTDCTQLADLQLAPEAACTLGVGFQPAQAGLVNGHVNIVDNTLNTTTSTQTIEVNGRGVALQSQTISFPNPGPVTYGVVSVSLSATTTSGLPISYTVISGPATVSGSTLMITGAGSVVVQAKQAGNSTYEAATPVSVTVTVNKAKPEISWPTPGAVNVGTALGSTQLNASANVSGTFVYNPTSGTVMSSVGPTMLSVTFTPTDTTDYSSATATVTLTVNSVTPAAITSPTNGSTLTGASTTFTWSAGTGVTGYYLWVGTTLGGNNLVNIGPLAGTSRTVTLPTNGIPIYVRLYSVINGTPSQYNAYTYTEATGAVPAAITSPTSGSTLTGASTTFTWSAGTGVTGYYLWVGTTLGTANLVNMGPLSGTSTTVNLPTNGAPIYVRLYSVINGTPSQYNAYTYTEATGAVPAAITSPTSGSTLTSASTTFTWTAGTGVTGYYLWVGTTLGGNNLVNIGPLSGTSTTVNLPTNGVPIYVRLYSVINGTPSQYNAYTYTEATGAVPAAIISPTNGSTLTGASTTFTWSAGTGVTGYYLWVGTTLGGNNLVNIGPLAGTSTTVNLPTNGAPIYVRLYSVINGTPSQYNAYTYTEATGAVPAAITSPTNGSTLTGASTTFTWSKGTGVTGYYLWVGTTLGGNNLVNIGPLAGTSTTVTLPTNGAPIYVRLYSVINGSPSQYNAYTYTEATGAVPAAITSPANGSTLTSASTTFTWTAGTGVTGYYLWVGTTLGGNNLVNIGPLAGTSRTVTLPTNGAPIYVRLYSVINGTPSQYNSYTYTEFH